MFSGLVYATSQKRQINVFFTRSSHPLQSLENIKTLSVTLATLFIFLVVKDMSTDRITFSDSNNRGGGEENGK